MVLAAFVVVTALAGCRFATTRIGDIQARPGGYLNREVTVAGSVTDSIKLPFLPGLYSVNDGSGVISVLTNSQPPLSGDRVRIRARVASAATIGGQTVGLGPAGGGTMTLLVLDLATMEYIRSHYPSVGNPEALTLRATITIWGKDAFQADVQATADVTLVVDNYDRCSTGA